MLLEENMDSTQFLEQLRAYAKNFTSGQRTETELIERVNSFLDQNYSVYLESTPEDCEKIRASFYINRSFEQYLFEYTRRAIAQLQATHEETWLWRGLVSTSLENSGIDWRDTVTGLTDLFIAAKKQRIDPKIAFHKVANLSSKYKPRGGTESVYKMIMDFDDNKIEF
jgi:hypothetical protein